MDGLYLNTLNINDDVNYRLGEGYDTGSPAIEQVALSSLLVDGEVLAGVRSGNRSFSVPVYVMAAGRITLAEALGALARIVNQETFTLRHEPDGGLPIVFDCFRGLMSKTDGMLYENQGFTTVLLTFQALPFGRNPQAKTLTTVTSNLSALLAGIKGTARTPARIEIDLPPDANSGGGWSVLLAAFSGARAGFDPYVFYGGTDGTDSVLIDPPAANFKPGTYQVWARCRSIGGTSRATTSVYGRGNSSTIGAYSAPAVVSAPFGEALQTRFLGEVELPPLPIASTATGVTFRLETTTVPGTSSAKFYQLYLIPSDATVAFTQGWARNTTSTMVFDSRPDGTMLVSAGSDASQAVSIMDLTFAAGVITLSPGANRLFVSPALSIDSAQARAVDVRVTYSERFHFDRDTLGANGFGGGFAGGFT